MNSPFVGKSTYLMGDSSIITSEVKESSGGSMPGRHNNDVFKKGWTTMYKNIDKQTKLTLKELVEYQEGQVVSKTLVQNDYVSMTIFSFDKGEEISTHAAGGDAMVTVLEGKGRFTVGDEVFYVEEGETLIMPKDIPHAVYGEERFKMQLTVSF